MMTSSICLITCLLAVGLPVIMGFPNGPPVDTHPELCHEMFPSGHLAQARTEGSPYEIIIGSSCYKPGLDITVFVKVNTSDETAGSTPRYFKGLFIMARTDADDGELDNTTNHGTFNVMSDADLATYPCYSMPDSAVGHNRSEEWTCKKLTWRATSELRDRITFQATVVRHKSMFWTDIRSEPIAYKSDCVADDTEVACDTTSGSDVPRAVAILWFYLVLVIFQ